MNELARIAGRMTRQLLVTLVVVDVASCNRKSEPPQPPTEAASDPPPEASAPPKPAEAIRPGKSAPTKKTPGPSTMLDLSIAKGSDSRIRRSDVNGLHGVALLERVSELTFRPAALGGSDDPAAYDERFRSYTLGQRILVVVADLEMEVQNGGFEQYFGNSSGDYAREVVPALRRLNLPQFANIASDANSLFPEGRPPHDRVARNAALEKVDKTKLEALDARFDKAYGKEEQIAKAMEQYIMMHSDEFFRD